MQRPRLRHDVPLSTLTTLGIGGNARALASVGDRTEIALALEWAAGEKLPVRILGGGSNLLVADRGFEGLLLHCDDTTVETLDGDGKLRVGAGRNWDDLVAWTVDRSWAGLECLSGIPGLCGAAPIQNIGAYGQELSSVLEAVEVFDLGTGQSRVLPTAACGLAYRASHFKSAWAGRYFLTGMHLRLQPGGEAPLRYDELRRLAEERNVVADDLAAVRALVLEIRRGKSMLADPHDPDGRSAGSFFTNPVVESDLLERVATLAGSEDFPQWPEKDGRAKLSAAWLIQSSGFEKGAARGGVGLSTRHVLALVNRGGGTAAEVLEFAREIRDRVLERFGVRLVPEPATLGFEDGEIDDLWA